MARSAPVKMVAACVAASVFSAVVAGCGGGAASTVGTLSNIASMSPINAVIFSAKTTSASGTADAAVNETITARAGPRATDAQSTSITVTGMGQIDFRSESASMSLTEEISGRPVAVKVLVIAGRIFLSIAGQASITGGKDWTQYPLNLSSVNGAGSLGSADNPADFLRLVEQRGESAKRLGSSHMAGVEVTEFAVTMNSKVFRAAEQQVLDQMGLSSAALQVAEKAVASAGVPTIKLWIDNSGLVRREALSLRESVSREFVSIETTGTFSNYGTPVDITAPPASDVVSYSTFLKDAAASSSGSNPLG